MIPSNQKEMNQNELWTKSAVFKKVEKPGLSTTQIIGWDFPVVSQKQINVYNMHGHAAALILPAHVPDYVAVTDSNTEVVQQDKQKHDKSVLSCFEKEYVIDGVEYMDVYIALE